MLSKRLSAIANLVKKNDKVLDVGTDHAYLPIELKKKKLCKEVYASDISKNAVEGARKNILKSGQDIKVFLSDGLEKIDCDYNTLIISGMGTSTIKKIIESGQVPKKIILSSNNNLYELRKFMNKIGYKIKKEIVVNEKKFYDIIEYEKGKEKLNKSQLMYGKSKDKDYYKYLYNKEKELLKKVNFTKKIPTIINIIILKRMLDC